MKRLLSKIRPSSMPLLRLDLIWLLLAIVLILLIIVLVGGKVDVSL